MRAFKRVTSDFGYNSAIRMNEPIEPIIDSVPVAKAPTPWGPWASLGLALVVLVCTLVIQLGVAIGFAAIRAAGRPHFDYGKAVAALASNGLYLSVVECLTLPVCGFLLFRLASLRRIAPQEYLALVSVPWPTIALWTGIALVFNISSDVVTFLLHRPVVPEFMRSVYATAESIPLLWLAVVLIGPFFEELLFRGFLFRGLAGAKTGVPGAIVITSLIWASLHAQYDFYGIAQVFVMGLLLGYVRARTGSLYTTLAMHAMANAQAILEAAYVVKHRL